ncbi:TnpV protein [Ruminococcus champanellensis]|uniref:TnpV protein n=1 Tax=Ruminococcus champanellensis TaxID=1161942 RepID=UPI00248B52B6|nr:TnpV protein [Ruminococcus champanellensis]
MRYEEFQMLTPEEMEQIPDMELPEVPKELLHNFLTQSRAIRKEGVLGWEVKQQRNGTSWTCFLPLLKSRQIGSVTFWYQVNPTIGTYEMRTEPEELTMETEPIGSYGLAWMHWMEENYPEKVEEMRFYHRFLTVARSVDKRAWEYRNRLDSQYQSENPRPHGFEKIQEWEQMRTFYTDSATMRDIIHQAVTTP